MSSKRPSGAGATLARWLPGARLPGTMAHPKKSMTFHYSVVAPAVRAEISHANIINTMVCVDVFLKLLIENLGNSWQLFGMCSSAQPLIMPRGSPNKRKPQHSPAVRRLAGICMFYVLNEKQRKKARQGITPDYNRGKHAESQLQTAYVDFCNQLEDLDKTAAPAKIPTKDQFRQLSRRYVSRHMRGITCENMPHPKRVNLSQAEWKKAGRIIGKPVEDRKTKYHAFRSVHDCMTYEHKRREQFRKLVIKSCLSETAFETHMLRQCPKLTKRKVDKRDALCATTLKDRQRMADIWARRTHWKLRPIRESAARSGFVPKVVRTRSQAAMQPVFFRKEYYMNFTFMYDHMHMFTDTGAVGVEERAFFLRDEDFPPEEVRPRASLSSGSTVMFTAVIHPKLGLVLGPDVMYWGSFPTATGDDTGRHSPSFPHWYGISAVIVCALVPHTVSGTCETSVFILHWHHHVAFYHAFLSLPLKRTQYGTICVNIMIGCCRYSQIPEDELTRLEAEYGYPAVHPEEYQVCVPMRQVP